MTCRTPNGSNKRPRGQVLILVAVGIFVILGALALCTDVAVFYFNWSQLRKEADAAALAGASYLPTNTSQATATSAQYVELNGQAGDSIVQNALGNLGYNGMANTSLTVQLSRTVPFYFGRVFGLLPSPVVVLAIAAVEPISGADGWIPIATQCSGSGCYKCTPPSSPSSTCNSVLVSSLSSACYSGASVSHPTQIVLTTSSVGPGNWEPLACTGTASNPGASGYQAGLTSGCGSLLEVNGTASIDTKPGVMPNATLDGISQRIGCTGTACAQSVCPDPTQIPGNRVVLIPLMDTSQFQGRTTAPVYGFATGWIESVSKSTIPGIGVQTQVVLDVISGPTTASGVPDPNGPNTGPFAPTLIQ